MVHLKDCDEILHEVSDTFESSLVYLIMYASVAMKASRDQQMLLYVFPR